MFHLAAYTALIDTTVNFDVAALADDILDRPNNHFRLGMPMNLVMAAVMSPTLLRARLDSAILRQINNPYIRPFTQAAIPGTLAPAAQWFDAPFQLPVGEEIAMQGTAAPGTTERFTGLIWLQDNYDPTPPGNIIRLYATSTTAAVVNAWTSVVYTLNASLPAGRYALVGSEVFSTNAIAHRWIIPNQVLRPGALSVTSLGNQQNMYLQSRRLGMFGNFRSDFLPQLQVIANVADAAHTIFMDVVRTGAL